MQVKYLGELFVYGFLGLFGTAGHYLTLYLLVEWFAVPVLLATSAGFALGAIINHELNRRFLFRQTRRSYRGSASRFFSVALFGFFVNLFVMYLLFESLRVHYFLAQLSSTATVVLLTFILNRIWTFRR